MENQKQDFLLLGNLIPDGNDKFNMHIKYITVLPVSQSGMPERPFVDNLSNGYYDMWLEYWICVRIVDVSSSMQENQWITCAKVISN